ncbi:MAG: LysR family transcriptional regulator, partial [Pseudomonadota bacterium]
MKQAAALLRTDPTTVSRHIKALSQKFDQNIFELEKSGQWRLTSTGDELVALAEMFKNRLDSLQSNASGLDPDQTITVTSLEFLLAHYIAPFMKRPIPGYPDVALRLIGSDRRLSLAYGEADIALRFGRPVEGQLMASKIASIEYCVFANPDQPPTQWIAMHEDLDAVPEMKLGCSIRGDAKRWGHTKYAETQFHFWDRIQ